MDYLNKLNLPSAKIPNQVTLTLHLLQAEIKHHTLTNSFEKIGMDTSMFTSNLSGLVLALCGSEKSSDKLFEWYYKKLDEYVDENTNGDLPLNELSFSLYNEIVTHLKKGVPE